MSAKRRPGGLVLFTFAVLCASAAAAAGDPTAGQVEFAQQCAACHSMTPGVNGVGPPLDGIVGRPIGSSPGFAYTTALSKAGAKWTQAGLDSFLADSGALYPGARMNVRISDPQTRADLIAYLLTPSSGRQ